MRPPMTANATAVRLIGAKRHEDARGWFTEIYSEATFSPLGILCRFGQDSHSLSRSRYTLRGAIFRNRPTPMTSWCVVSGGAFSMLRSMFVRDRRPLAIG